MPLRSGALRLAKYAVFFGGSRGCNAGQAGRPATLHFVVQIAELPQFVVLWIAIQSIPTGSVGRLSGSITNAFRLPTPDQLLPWSVILATAILNRVTKAPPGAPAAIAPFTRRAARLAHRALQALRQSRLQMCRGTRPWSEVLPLGELPKATAADGLPTPRVLHPGTCRPRPLPTRPRDPRADLRDQSRTAAASRDALRCHGERDCDAHRRDRRSLCEHFARQHAPGLARCRTPNRYGRFGGRCSAGWQCGGG